MRYPVSKQFIIQFIIDQFATRHKVVQNGGSPNFKGCYSTKTQLIWLKFCKAFWLSPRNFFRGLLSCKFLLLFYCFRTKFQGGAKVFKGGKLPQGGRPLPPPLWEKASLSYKERSIILPKFITFGLLILILGTSAIMNQTACCYAVTP